MQETLHFPATPFHLHNPQFPFISRPNRLHLPPKSSAVALPSLPKPPSLIISPEIDTPPASSPPPLQELLLYLDSLGVDSLYCLHSHPPLISTPLSQVKRTVDFLFSLGLTVQDLRRVFAMCPDLLTSSTSTIIIPAATFLLREAQVGAVNLRHVIHRRPRLLTRSVDRQLRPTLYFLQGTIGIENVANCASLLSCCVESKFIPRIEYLQQLGFSYKDTIVMFRRFPALFCYSIKENLKPKFDYFVVEMGRELKELVAFPQYFSFSFDNRIKPRHKMCVEKQVCLSLPMMLKSSEARFRDLLEVYCGSSIPVLNVILVHYGVCNLTSNSECLVDWYIFNFQYTSRLADSSVWNYVLKEAWRQVGDELAYMSQLPLSGCPSRSSPKFSFGFLFPSMKQ